MGRAQTLLDLLSSPSLVFEKKTVFFFKRCFLFLKKKTLKKKKKKKKTCLKKKTEHVFFSRKHYPSLACALTR